jgi:hypothetical protein
MTPGGAQPEPSGPDAGTPPARESAEARVGRALHELDHLGHRPLAEHAPEYERLHDELQAVLSEIDGA